MDKIITDQGFWAFYSTMLNSIIFGSDITVSFWFCLFSLMTALTICEMFGNVKLLDNAALFTRMFSVGAFITILFQTFFFGFKLLISALIGMSMSLLIVGIPLVFLSFLWLLINGIVNSSK